MKQGVRWWCLALCWAWLAWPGAAGAQEAPWRFVVFGDCISFDDLEFNTNIVGELGYAIAVEHPAFLLFAGDCTSSGSTEALQRWTNALSPLYEAGIPIFPTAGNHEMDAEAFTNIVAATAPENGPPGEEKTTYALAWSNALLVVLNEYAPTNTLRVNQAWLDSVLATNTRPHVFAMGHAPAFSIFHPDYLGMYMTNRDDFWNSLGNAHARLYFCGHDHMYDHSQIDDGDGDPQNDVHQFIVGTGGAPLYPVGPYRGQNGVWTPRRIWHDVQYGFLSVEVAGEKVTTTWHHRTGTNTYEAAEVFSYTLTRLPFLRHRYTDGRLTLTWEGGGALQEASEPDGRFQDVPGAQSPYVVTNLDHRFFFRLAERPPK